MATETQQANTSNPSVNARGTSSVSFSITVTPPAFPEGVTKWNSVDLSISAKNVDGSGKSRAAYVTINGGSRNSINHNATTNINQNLGTNVTTRPTSYSGTVAGGHNQYNGTVTFSGGKITYTYTVAGGFREIVVRYGTRTILTDSAEAPIPVTYNGSTIASVPEGGVTTLNCSGMVMDGNVVINGHTLNCDGKLMDNNIIVEVS